METGWISHNQQSSNDNIFHEVQINLNLSIDNLLNGFNGNIVNTPEMIQQHADEIHESIFRTIAEDFVPDLVSNGISSKQAGVAPIESKSAPHTKWEGEVKPNQINVEKDKGGDLSIKKKMNMTFSLTTDKAVPTIEALYHARIGVADLVAGTIVEDLEKKYLGKSRPGRTTEATIENNEVIDYKSTTIPN